ncbi:MAG: ribonuclease H-like domain-containing protein [Chloroflexota bacterium]|nr:ribonuclease H-like domain-containing protein [Chloroflexota bacterium]
MRADIRQRLRELGVVKGARGLETPSLSPLQVGETRPRHRVAIENLVPGRFHTTSRGQCFVVEKNYSLDHLHGNLPLSAFLGVTPKIAAQVAQDGALAGVDLRRACFLDTETTGLSGGTGTMAFVVGLGFFEETGFHLHQYFLRDPGDEPAMVETLVEQLLEFEALVSFNGIAFDVPVLENRFILARTPPPTTRMPHLDLLPPARRLWRYHLPSRTLGTIEREILGVLREQDDVPGGVIPWLYRDYLRTGDGREMKRVLYHNAVDILSLVTLAVRLCRTFADPWDRANVSGAEFYGLGRWYAREERLTEAERAYRAALDEADLTPDLRTRTLRDLAHLLKRANRRVEAFAYWQQLALEPTNDVDVDVNDVLAHVELAKYLEWHVKNLSLAADWTRAAMARVEEWPEGERRYVTMTGLRHRLGRLERKMNLIPSAENRDSTRLKNRSGARDSEITSDNRRRRQ